MKIFLLLLTFITVSYGQYALQFTSAQSELCTTDSSAYETLGTTTDFVVSAWVRVDGGNFGYPLALFIDAQNYVRLICYANGVNTAQFSVEESNVYRVRLQTTDAKPTDRAWHHYVVSVDVSDNTNTFIYIDGVKETTYTYQVANTGDKDMDGATTPSKYSTVYSDITVDELAVWKGTTASDANVLAMYNSGYKLDYRNDSGDYNISSSLVSYYDFDAGSGDDLVDLVNSDYDMILGSSIGQTANDPTWVTGVPELLPTTVDDKYKKLRRTRKYKQW